MQRKTYFVDVIVPLAVPNKFTYRVPSELNEQLAKGKRVLVQFGKSKIYTGIIYNIHETAPKEYTVKYIEGILDDAPIVTETQLHFWDWLSFYYCANPGEVMNAALPSGLKLSSTSHVQLNSEFNFEESAHSFFTEREHLVLEALHITPNLSFDDLAELLKVKSVQPIIHNLLKKNAIEIYEDVKDKYKPKLQSFVKLKAEYLNEEKLKEVLQVLEKKSFKQTEALLHYLQLQKSSDTRNQNPIVNSAWVKKSDLTKHVENTSVTALVKKQIFEEAEFEVGRLYFEESSGHIKKLSPRQEAVYKEVKQAFVSKKPVLLHGVTGSGKTEVYIQLIKDTLEAKKQMLFLIPEIALTTQLITRLRAAFGELVGVYHSRFSENERVEIWNNILQSPDSGRSDKKQYQIILGARSCVFLPFSKLGLIIVDEEHDQSFKQHDPSPRYNARDTALYLAALHKSDILLGSATPSVESFYNVHEKKFTLVNLHKQFIESGGTDVKLCDLTYYQTSNQMKASLTPPLFDAITEALGKKQQVILFQNRRGFAPYTECKHCGHVPHCVQCDVSLIYHKQQQKLLCHYCGYSVNPPKTCAACGSNALHHKGIGTEKIEEDIELLFPQAKVARMDLDSTRSKHAYKQLIDDFESGNVDILIGTQMVTKGLDFANVSVVGILNADSIINFPDFRSFERAFQLITQVRGRAGRSHEVGKVFVQTSRPEHKVFDYILKNNFNLLYSDTLHDRKQFFYPPYSRLFEVNIISKDLNELNHLANELFKLLKDHFKEHLLGPEFPLVAKIKNSYYKRILIKSARSEKAMEVRQHLYRAINDLQHQHQKWRYRVSIDVDPM